MMLVPFIVRGTAGEIGWPATAGMLPSVHCQYGH
jgi:hypothetical protein